MSNERFMVDDCGTLIDISTRDTFDYVSDTVDLLNRLNDENEQLKQELQRIYNLATLNKAIGVLEDKYDRMLSDGSDEVKDAMRHTVLKCIEDLDELKDEMTQG